MIQKTLKKLKLIYYSFYVLAIATATFGFQVLKGGWHIDEKSSTGIALSSILIIVIIGAVPLSLALFNKFVKKLAQEEVSEDIKLKKYEKASIIRIVIIGIGLLAGVLFFYVMKSQSMLFCAGIAAIGLFFCKPTEVKLITDLNLEEQDI